MRRSTLILVVALAVIVIGGGVYFGLNWSKVTDLFNGTKATNKTTNTVINTNVKLANTNKAVTNVSLPTEVKGNLTLDGTITVASVKLHLSSLQWVSQYDDLKAAAGQNLLVVYMDALPVAQVTPVADELAQNVQLQTKTGTIKMRRYKLASDEVKNDRGYLLFEVPDTATNLAVIRGSGPTAETVSVPTKK